MRRVALGALIPVAVLVAWSLSALLGILPEPMPSPWALGAAAVELAQRGILFGRMGISAQLALQGFAIGAAAGLLFGTVMARSPGARALLSPTIRAIRAVPVIAWLPLLVLLLGVGGVATTAVIALASALPVVTATAAGRWGDPAPVFAGLRQGLAQSWLVLVAAELVGPTAGLGALLVGAGGGGRIDRLLVTIAVFALLAALSDLVLGVAERLVRGRSAAAATLDRNTDHL